MKRNFIDNSGKTLDREKVEQLAIENLVASNTIWDLAEMYVSRFSYDDLMEWATDQKGNFSK